MRIKLSALLLLSLYWGIPAQAAAELPSTGGSTQTFTADDLLRQIARREPLTLPFEETTENSLLTAPLRSRGFLRFTPPATLEKRIEQPQQERYVIDGDKVLAQNPAQHLDQTLSLQDFPPLRAFVEAFRAVLVGDAASLRRYYKLELSGGAWRWVLHLKPLDPAAREYVASIRLSGEENRVTAIQVLSPEGDRSSMSIGPWPR